GDVDVTIAEVAETVRSTVADTQVVDVPGRGGDFSGARVSNERAARELGWRATTPFAAGVARYADWHRTQAEAPAAVLNGAPSRKSSRFASPRVLAGRAAPAVLLSSFVLMLAGFLEVLHKAGSGADDIRTIVITSLLGLTAFLTLVPPSRDRRREPRLAGVPLLSAGVLLLMVLRWPHDALQLAHPDVELVLQSPVG